MHQDTRYFHISLKTMIQFLAILLGFAAFYVVRDVIASLFFAVIVASAIEPAILWLKERNIPRILSVVLIYLAAGVFIFFTVYLVFPLVFEDLRDLVRNYGFIQQRIVFEIGRVEALPIFSLLPKDAEDFAGEAASYLETAGRGIFSFASAVFGGVFSFFLIVIFSFYLAAQERGIENFLRLASPLAYEPYIIDLWERAQKKLGRWLRTQVLLGAIVGIMVFFGLTFLGVKNALLFAILAGLFEIIPVVGPVLAAVPAVLTAFVSSPLLGAFTVLLYVVIQQIESHLIIPVVMRKTMGLSPLVVVLALLVGVKIGGVFGLLLAVPITVILAEFINDWDKKKRALIPE